MRTLAVLLKKEFLQIMRNSFLPRLIVAFPIVIMLVMPWITTMDVRNVGVIIVDDDRSSTSKRIISHISASEYFTPCTASDYETALEMLEQGKADVIVQIPAHFERELITTLPGRINISANAVNATKGSIGMQYLVQTIAKTLTELRNEKSVVPISEIITVQNRYNPTLNYRHYMIPALMIMLLILVCGFLPALNIVSEKEKGTIEQINVTPVKRITFTLAKLNPYWLIGLFVLSVAMLTARIAYGLAPAGSLGVIYLSAVLFILAISGLGVAIANRSDTMQQVMFVMFFFVMIFMLMSGLMTPINSMPVWAQKVTIIFPPRYFIDIMRSVYLKGTAFIELLPDLAALSIFAILFNIFAALTYKKQA